MKFPSVHAVSNCALVPVIPTMDVWSPVFVPEDVPLWVPERFEPVMTPAPVTENVTLHAPFCHSITLSVSAALPRFTVTAHLVESVTISGVTELLYAPCNVVTEDAPALPEDVCPNLSACTKTASVETHKSVAHPLHMSHARNGTHWKSGFTTVSFDFAAKASSYELYTACPYSTPTAAPSGEKYIFLIVHLFEVNVPFGCVTPPVPSSYLPGVTVSVTTTLNHPEPSLQEE